MSKQEARRPAGSGQDTAPERELPGDPACLLRRVCQACGAVAAEDPPTSCPQCHAALTGS